jgi:SAM-dependent methyltransferase
MRRTFVAKAVRPAVAAALLATFLPSFASPAAARCGAPGPVRPAQSQPDIGFAPTPHAVVDGMLQLARVGPDDVVYDLGAGDGRIVIRAAEKYGARSVGVELQPHLVGQSRQAAREAGVDGRVTFIEGDLFGADISGATVVMLYLSPAVNARLEPKLRQELRPGTRIVSRQFGIGSWVPEQAVRAEDGTDLLLWTIPRRPVRTPDIYFVPTPQPVAEHMLALARVGPDDVVYDLGSGDGRIVMLAALEYGARGVGIELEPTLVAVSGQVARDAEIDGRVMFIEGDLFVTDISEATVVTLYLSPNVNRRLEPKLKRELRPGARIVSRQFGIGDWTPDEIVRAEDGTMLYLWTIPPP